MIRLVRCSSFAAALAALTSACFVEAPPVQDDGGTTGPSCEPGHSGCACYGNGTCEAGLECNPDVTLCIPASCDPGQVECVCLEGDCVAPWVCQAGLCKDGGSDSTDTETTVASVDTSSTMTMSSSAGPTTDPDTTTDDSGTSSAVDTDETTAGSGCAELGCAMCVECVDGLGRACQPEFDACNGTPGCLTAVHCLVQCGVYFDCLDPCCQGLDAPTIDVVEQLVYCKSDQCVMPCEGVAELDGCPG